MRNITLRREPSIPDGTFGEWISDSGFTCKTLEKPWADNKPNQSCVPIGRYHCLWQWSPKHQMNLYHLQDVPGREAIEIHSANIQSQLQGCISLGFSIAVFTANSIKQGIPQINTKGVTSSMETMVRMETDMRDTKTGEQLPFALTIMESTG